jgi:hypothetical protein
MNDAGRWMTVADALQCVLVLAEWTPPEGVLANVACSAAPGVHDGRRVTVTMSAFEGCVAVLDVESLPEPSDLDALTAIGHELLRRAWDEPACEGIGPGPILDTAKMGRDA